MPTNTARHMLILKKGGGVFIFYLCFFTKCAVNAGLLLPHATAQRDYQAFSLFPSPSPQFWAYAPDIPHRDHREYGLVI